MLNFKQVPLSVYFGLIIVLSSAFTRQVYNNFIERFSREHFNYLVIIAIIILLIVFIRVCSVKLFRKFRKFSKEDWVCLILPLILLFILNYLIDLPEERIHILIFGLLGWRRVLEVSGKGLYKVFIFVIIFSVFGELFQALLPHRVCDIRDVFIDSASGICGALLGRFSVKNS